jgi:hypothetical protein
MANKNRDTRRQLKQVKKYAVEMDALEIFFKAHS